MKIEELKQLPGADLIFDGIERLKQSEETETSLLVAIGVTRLRAAGLEIPPTPPSHELPEHRLYRRLAQEYGNDAHSRYNALLRRLVSFERALEAQRPSL